MPRVRLSEVELVFDVKEDVDVNVLQGLCGAWCQMIGTSRRVEWDVSLAAGEAACGMLRHSGGGRLELTLATPEHQVIRLEAKDQSNGLGQQPSSGGSCCGGSHESSGLVAGLGSIARLMDHLEVISNKSNGTHLVATKWLHNRPS